MFLKGKQEASGFPFNLNTEGDKENYRQEYFEKEGVMLDLNNVEKNPAKRFINKIFLNSMWGRLGMNSNRSCYKIIKSSDEWFQMLSDDQYKIDSIDLSYDEAIQVFYHSLAVESSYETSVTHAAFVTCYARLKLYSELEKLGKQVLYFDTDSVIFVYKPGQYLPKTGNFLGELTNELDENDFIEEFVSAGPKNYAYKTVNGKYKYTIKGFSLNAETKSSINFESIKNIVINDNREKIGVDQLKFKRDKKAWQVESKVERKEYGFVYDKRILLDNLETLPYGF